MNPKILAELRKVLAHLYQDELSIRRIIGDSGIDCSRINFNTTAVNIWDSVLKEAGKNRQIDTLLSMVENEYGRNEAFLDVYNDYHRSADQDKLTSLGLPVQVNRHETQFNQNESLDSQHNRNIHQSSEYHVPAYWFDPKMLRRWLWENRSSLVKETKEALQEILISGMITDQYSQADIHTVVKRVILNRNIDYTEIIGSLDNVDFKRFVIDTIYANWTDLGFSWVEPQNFFQIKQALTRYFNRSNLKPRFCVWNIGQEIERATAQACVKLDFAGQVGGYRTKADIEEVLDEYQKAVQHIEHLFKLLLEFSAGLTEMCGLQSERYSTEMQIGNDQNIEMGLNNYSADLLNLIDTEQLPSNLNHWRNELTDFARLCYRTPKLQIGKQEKKVILLGAESYQMYRGPAPNTAKNSNAYVEDHLTRFVELPQGQLMKLCTGLEKHHNSLAAAKNSIRRNLPLPSNFYRNVQVIDSEAQALINILRNEVSCIPETVRLISLTYRLESIELDAVAIPERKEYNLIYTDEEILHKLAHKASESLAYTKGDQDFWLFPAPSRPRSYVLNPILIPRSVVDEYKLDFTLQLENIAQTITTPKQFEEEPFKE